MVVVGHFYSCVDRVVVEPGDTGLMWGQGYRKDSIFAGASLLTGLGCCEKRINVRTGWL